MSDEIKIEKGVPMGEGARGRKSGPIKKALLAAKVGDSFVIPPNGGVYSTAFFAGVRVHVEKQPDGTIRVWRIK